MPWEIARDWLFFCAIVLGGGLALAPARRDFAALEAWCVGIAGSLAVLSAAVLLVFWLGWPSAWIALGHAAVAIAALVFRRRVVALGREDTVREAALVWLLVAAGALALLACIFSYSGGTWMGDWEEHFHRPLVMLRLRPEDGFHAFFAFTSRPPLANAADAALLWVAEASLARHQLFMLLLNSLAFLPAALWCRTMGGGRAAASLTGLLLLLNPLFLQNTTYAWTKLITVFFVLTGLHVLLTGGLARTRVVTGFALLTLGVLSHYSAGVWLLTFGLGWLLANRRRWPEREFRLTTGLAALTTGILLAPWFFFAVARYGVATTLTSNPSYAAAAKFSWWDNLLSSGPKLWNSLIPHPLRGVEPALITQNNPWTLFRDEVFLVYQANLFWGAGSVGLLLLSVTALKPGWRPKPPSGRLWLGIGLLTVVVGTAVHGDVDPWGMAHVCLQPLMLLGVALAASRLPRLVAGRHQVVAMWAATLVLADCVLGIWLHYTATAFQLNRPAGQPLLDYVAGLSGVAQHNLLRKIHYRQDFFMDTVDLPLWVAFTIFASIATLVGLRAWRISRQESLQISCGKDTES